MNDLDEILLEILTIPIDKVPQGLQNILLVLVTRSQRRSVVLDQLKEFFRKADSDLEQGLGCDKL